MKKLITIIFAVALGLNLSAQTDYVETWDPDADGDGLIGVSDLLALLGVFQEGDMDNDGIWDSQDDCVGAYDECDVCNGPGPQILGIDTIIVYYDSLYAEAIDEWWVFELYSDTLLTYLCENPGCMDPMADNYDPYAIEEDGSCVYSNGSPVCDFEPAIYFDGHTYDLVAIGDQCWFAENLRTEHYTNGDAIPANLTDGEWSSTNSGAVAVYGEDAGCTNNSPDGDACDPTWSLNEYGRRYNWYAVFDARGLCPTGWHVPTDGEWMTLEMELGMSESEANDTGWRGTDQGTQMKTTYGWIGGGNGTNSSGFSGLPGGYRGTNGNFNNAGYHGYWWSSSYIGSYAWNRCLYYGDPNVNRGYTNPKNGFSVRCLKDAD